MSSGDDHSSTPTLDHVAIVNLLHRYSDSVTRGQLDRDEELFTPDAVVEIGEPFGQRIEGAGAIRQWRSRASADFELLIHTTYSEVVELLGPTQAKVTSQTREMVRSAEQAAVGEGIAMNLVFYSIYFDDLVKTDGVWKFARRVCRPIYLESGSLNGQVCQPGPMPGT
jgi:hypothetical protein